MKRENLRPRLYVNVKNTFAFHIPFESFFQPLDCHSRNESEVRGKFVGKKTNKSSKYVKGQLNSLNFKKDNQDYRH